MSTTEAEVFSIFKSNCVSYPGNYEVTPGQALMIAKQIVARDTPSPSITEAEQACLDIFGDYDGTEIATQSTSTRLAWAVGGSIHKRLHL
jgi:hypothetical protein